MGDSLGWGGVIRSFLFYAPLFYFLYEGELTY